MTPNAMRQQEHPKEEEEIGDDVGRLAVSTTSTNKINNNNKLTACFIFPEASGHINASLALSSYLSKSNRWDVHYLSAEVMKECIEDAGATFTDERDVAPELCQPSDQQDDDDENNDDDNNNNTRLGYFAAYERLRKQLCPPGSKAWEGRAHIENRFLLMKLPGTIEWISEKNPDVVVYCPIWNRVAQIASLVLNKPHVAIVTIAGFGGFHKILNGFLEPEGVTLDEFRQLYETSSINQNAIDELCSPPYNLDRSLFVEGAPVYYFGREPDCAPYGKTLGKHSLVTTIPSLRDPIYSSIEQENELYLSKCGSYMHYIGPMVGTPGQIRASTHKAVFTLEEQQLLIKQSNQSHRRRSDLHDKENLVALVKQAKSHGRRVVLISLGTVVTSDRAAFGWKGTGLGTSITGKQLVQSAINGVIDALQYNPPAFDKNDNQPVSSKRSSIQADTSSSPLLICAVGQQPDALDDILLPPNSIARASVPQVDILRQMTSTDLFVHHGGQNSTMEGGYAGIPMIVCPTFGDQPVNATKLVHLKVALSVDRPTKSGLNAVTQYRQKVATAVETISNHGDTFSAAAEELKNQIALGGGEEMAESILLSAI